MRGGCLKSHEMFWSSAIVRDRGAYDGVAAAAHEFGHMYERFSQFFSNCVRKKFQAQEKTRIF